MDGDQLNRIGISLNVVAGFLLAPELIGIERIRRWEQTMETRVIAARSEIMERERRVRKLGNPLRMESAASIAWSVVGIGLVHVFVLLLSYIVASEVFTSLIRVEIDWIRFALSFISSIILYSLAIIISVTVVIIIADNKIGEVDHYDEYAVTSKGFDVLHFALFPVYPYVFMVNVGRFVIVIAWCKAMINCSHFLTSKLRGEDKVKGYLVLLGIIAFVTGNLLQFIATF